MIGLRNLLEFLRHLTDGDMLLRMKGGTPAFVDSLIKGIDIHSGSAIKKVELQGEKYWSKMKKVTKVHLTALLWRHQLLNLKSS